MYVNQAVYSFGQTANILSVYLSIYPAVSKFSTQSPDRTNPVRFEATVTYPVL